MSKWVWHESMHRFNEEFIAEHILSTEVVAAFDKKLHYLFVNPAACQHLDLPPESVLGKSIIELYPDIIASRNHRNILRALEGESIQDVFEGRWGHHFEAEYIPVFEKNELSYVLVRAKTLK